MDQTKVKHWEDIPKLSVCVPADRRRESQCDFHRRIVAWVTLCISAGHNYLCYLQCGTKIDEIQEEQCPEWMVFFRPENLEKIGNCVKLKNVFRGLCYYGDTNKQKVGGLCSTVNFYKRKYITSHDVFASCCCVLPFVDVFHCNIIVIGLAQDISNSIYCWLVSMIINVTLLNFCADCRHTVEMVNNHQNCRRWKFINCFYWILCATHLHITRVA